MVWGTCAQSGQCPFIHSCVIEGSLSTLYACLKFSLGNPDTFQEVEAGQRQKASGHTYACSEKKWSDLVRFVPTEYL